MSTTFCKIFLPNDQTFKLSTLPSSFQSLLDTIASKSDSHSSNRLHLKYMDSEEELVVLNSEEDLQTAILTMKTEQMTTLKIYAQYRDETQSLGLRKNCSDESPSQRNQGELSLRNVSSAPFSEVIQGNTDLLVLKDKKEGLINGSNRVNKVAKRNIKGLFAGLTGRLRSQGDQGFDISKSAPLFGAQNGQCESICSECQEQIGQGVTYMCLECSRYRCCELCEAKAEHGHPLLKVRDSLGNQSVNMKTRYRNSYGETPEKRENNKTQRFSFSRGSSEKKANYMGKAFLENTRDQVITTYPFQEEKVTVIVKNTGTETWPVDAKLSCVNGAYRNREENLLALEQGEKQSVTLYLRAPCKADRYLSQWRITYSEEGKMKSFGESLFIEVQVEENKVISKQRSLQSVQCEEKVSTNLVRRAKTLTEAFFKRNEEQGKSQKESNDNRVQVAEWLNEIFPGNLEGKLEFLNECDYKGNAEDMARIVGLYLQSLIKVRSDGNGKQEKEFVGGRQEICAALV